VGFEGMGFGLSMAVNMGPAASAGTGSPGDYMWGGAASTTFWVDPAEDLLVVFMTQLLPSGTFNFRGQLRSLVYPAIAD
jgi:CubicO group peptidase (beta-lactamase class C family)